MPCAAYLHKLRLNYLLAFEAKMAFRFRARPSVTGSSKQSTNGGGLSHENTDLPKLTNAQLDRLAKLFPSWLKDNTPLKQLPGIYQGVLGQVQLQPGIEEIERRLIGKQEKPTDYMNKFTDTERVHQLLSASQLPNETLATIWAHVNKTFPGKLTNREVCLALALIAIFQRLDRERSNGVNHFSPSSKDRDPFLVVKVEKKPPVPTLYSARTNNNNNNDTRNNSGFIKGIVQSKSTPENLSSARGLLVDISSGNDDTTTKEASSGFPGQPTSDNYSVANSNLDRRVRDIILTNPINLMDMNSDTFEIDFNSTTNIWYKFLHSMKGIFKRSFDVLNVENSRQSAIEALKSPRGIDFGRNLSLCYPLAHNIKHKFDQLNSIKLATDEQSDTKAPMLGVFDKKYAVRIDDLMTSINEYWAVLINLLHESGQTDFIELIMDGLVQTKDPNVADSIGDIAAEFSSNSGICCICHIECYLSSSYDFSSRQLSADVLSLVAAEDLVSGDGQHYYHPRCASFWLNQVDTTSLPFISEHVNQEILSPDLLGQTNLTVTFGLMQ